MKEADLRLGIDLGGTKMEGVLLDKSGSVILRRRTPTPQKDYRAILNSIAKLVEELTSDPGLPLGIGTPGSISSQTGLMRNSNSTCLNEQPLLQDLELKLKRPVRIANDANCFTLSEATDGAAQNVQVVFGVILGTGVGGGICINQEILSGKNGITGEWGHIPLPAIANEERSCFCGRENCVETWLSGPGLEATAKKFYEPGISTYSIAEKVNKNEANAVALIEEYCEKLASALAIVINILDPEKIVLGGGLSNIDALYKITPELLPKYVFSDHVSTSIVKAAYGDSSGVRGAAWLF